MDADAKLLLEDILTYARRCVGTGSRPSHPEVNDIRWLHEALQRYDAFLENTNMTVVQQKGTWTSGSYTGEATDVSYHISFRDLPRGMNP